jgi:hypothetical protein
MSDHGSFSGNPKTEWLVDPNHADRDMSLLEKFAFTDPDKRVWPAPKGAVVNGASIPQPLWSMVGSPYTDDYRRASVVHDVACNTPGVSRKEADVMFFHACRAGGCGPLQARILYAGVRIGAWTSKSFTKKSLSREALLFRNAEQGPSPEAMFLQGKLAEISREMEALPDEPSIAELDAAIKRHLRV